MHTAELNVYVAAGRILTTSTINKRAYMFEPFFVCVINRHAWRHTNTTAHLAKYHAISFALRDQRPEVFESLRVLKDFLAEFFESGNFVKMMYSGYELAETVLKDPAHVRIMKDVREKFFEILHSCVDAGVSEPFSVIGHGDFQINNIMWLYTDAKAKEVADLCFIDWQAPRMESPVLDVFYHIFTCTDRSFRQAEYHQLLKHYHSILSAQIQRLGSNPEKIFTFDDFHGQLKKFGKFPFIFAPVFVQHYLTAPENIANLDEMSEKMATENVDLRKGEFDNDTQTVYAQRQNELFEDLVGLGYWN